MCWPLIRMDIHMSIHRTDDHQQNPARISAFNGTSLATVNELPLWPSANDEVDDGHRSS